MARELERQAALLSALLQGDAGAAVATGLRGVMPGEAPASVAQGLQAYRDNAIALARRAAAQSSVRR